MALLRTILAVTRISNLPTVWSNCLAGWWLGGAGHTEHLPTVMASATLLYLGGALLKDVFDVEYDRKHRPDKPIPSGKFSETTLYRVGLVLLTVGALILLLPGQGTGSIGLFIACFIVLHNSLQRVLPLSPLFKGIVRLLFYLLGASVAIRGIGGWVIWCGLAMALFTTGLGYVAETSEKNSRPRLWPMVLLAVPVGLALVMNAGEYRESALLISAVLALWAIRSLRPVFAGAPPDLQRVLGGLTAAIVFVDWLAACPPNLPGPQGAASRQISFIFLGLFLLTLVFQRVGTAKWLRAASATALLSFFQCCLATSLQHG